MSFYADNLDLLWKLVEVDRKLVSFQADLDAANARLARSESRLEKALQADAEATAALKQATRTQRETEDELNQLEQRIRKVQEQAGTLASEEQIRHSQQAIAKQQEHRGELEVKGLEQLDAIASANESSAGARSLLDKQEQVTGAERDAVGTLRASLGSSIAGLRQERESYLPGLAAPVAEAYAAAHERNPGAGLCTIKEGYCAGCGGEHNVAHISTIKARAELTLCPYCKRIQDILPE